jgi:hypothetical protein
MVSVATCRYRSRKPVELSTVAMSELSCSGPGSVKAVHLDLRLWGLRTLFDGIAIDRDIEEAGKAGSSRCMLDQDVQKQVAVEHRG